MSNITIRNMGTTFDCAMWEKMASQGVSAVVQNYTKNNRPFISLNYPETLGKDENAPAAENKKSGVGKCVYRKQVSAGDSCIFFSHRNWIADRKYGIQIFNPNSGSVTVKKLKYGYCAGWDASPAAVQFLNDTSVTSKTLASGGVWWISEESIPVDTPFSGHLLINTSGPVIVTVYLYKSKSNISGNETIYPYSSDNGLDMQVYTGDGIGYDFAKTIELTIDAVSVASNTNLSKKNYYFTTGNGNSNELTPLTLEDGTVARVGAASPRENLGNWGCTYNYTVKVVNKTSVAKTVYGFVSSYGGRVAFKSSNTAGKTLETRKSWLFLQEVIPANSTKTFDYTFMLASHGTAACHHVFSLNSIADAP